MSWLFFWEFGGLSNLGGIKLFIQKPTMVSILQADSSIFLLIIYLNVAK